MKTMCRLLILLIAGFKPLYAQISPDETIIYKTIDEISLELHVFLPPDHQADSKTPGIVFFHGGGWNSGHPKHLYRQAAYLASRGMVALSASYRIKNEHGTSPFESVKDAMSAMRFVRANADRLGIDPDRIAAGGGSAGGHLAAATATLTRFNEESDDLTISPRPNALILFNAVMDNGPKGYGYNRIRRYLRNLVPGLTDGQLDQLLTDFSPYHNVHKNMPPTVSFLGTEDKLIPVETAKRFKANMEKLGVRSDLHLYEGQPHSFFNKAKYKETLLEVDKFFVSLGYLTENTE